MEPSANGRRTIILNRNGQSGFGFRLRTTDNLLCVCHVFEGSPADHGGIKLGNQILQINGNDLSVTSKSELRDLLHQAEKVVVVVQDHPSASSFRLRKDDDGLVGLNMQGKKIIGVMKGTHAAKSGVLAEHHLLDVEDTSVTGLYDSDVGLLLKEAAEIFTIKVIPSVIYNRMIQGTYLRIPH